MTFQRKLPLVSCNPYVSFNTLGSFKFSLIPATGLCAHEVNCPLQFGVCGIEKSISTTGREGSTCYSIIPLLTVLQYTQKGIVLDIPLDLFDN